MSIRVIKDDALEKIYENISKRITPLIKGLPDEDFFHNELEKIFKI